LVRVAALACAALVLAVPLLAGCARTRGGDARMVATHYFDAVSLDGEDRGWGLIHPEIRQSMFGNDREAYIALARQADWSTFRVEVEQGYADDDFGTFYLVSVRVPGGRSSVPAFLLQHGAWSLLPLYEGKGHDPTTATVHVRLEPFGGGGIWAAGG
jgi:hypothetical protein